MANDDGFKSDSTADGFISDSTGEGFVSDTEAPTWPPANARLYQVPAFHRYYEV